MPHPYSLLQRRTLIALFLALTVVLPAEAALKIYYLRHAQSGSNVANEWAHVPAAERPAFVGKGDTFSPLGWKQAAAVPDVLAPYHFDLIVVSGIWRTRNTIRPYLHIHGRTAEIWPELREYGEKAGNIAHLGRPDLPAPAADLLTAGPLLEAIGEDAKFFRIRPDSPRDILFKRGGPEGAADITEANRIVVERIRREFGGTDKSILLVGHANAGRYFLRYLTGDDYAIREGMKNTGLWLAEEQPDGTFRLTLANSAPIPAGSPGK